jgi:predicted alpha/beta hydrolase family esterase
MTAMSTVLFVPGLGGSGPGHWQDWWLRSDSNAVLVEQSSWRHPGAEQWTERLVEAIEAHPYSWIVAHSLGVALVTRLAASRLDLRIAGALLVAPSDVERMEGLSEQVRGFGPLSLAPLPFPATVVASRTDRWMQFRRARAFAAAWGAKLVDYGDAGHINVASGFGPWPDGPRLLSEVQSRRPQPPAVIHLRPRPRVVGGRTSTLT